MPRLGLVIIALCALLLAGTAAEATAGEPVLWQDQTVGRLDFPAPSGASWTRKKQPAGLAYERLKRSFLGAAKRLLYLHVLRNSFPASMADWTEQEIADDFRDSEELGMQMMGVQTGMYSLLSLERGAETHAGRTLHTMKMVMQGGRGAGWRLQRQELYLLFPNDHASTREFYVILLGDFCIPDRCRESNLSVAELLPMLDRLRIRGE